MTTSSQEDTEEPLPSRDASNVDVLVPLQEDPTFDKLLPPPESPSFGAPLLAKGASVLVSTALSATPDAWGAALVGGALLGRFVGAASTIGSAAKVGNADAISAFAWGAVVVSARIAEVASASDLLFFFFFLTGSAAFVGESGPIPMSAWSAVFVGGAGVLLGRFVGAA